MNRLCTPLVTALLTAAAAATYAQAPAATPAKPAARHTDAAGAVKPPMVNTADLKWGPGPPAFNPGTEMAVIDGDPSKPGMFVLRAKLPDGFKIMPHWHPTDESVTVLSGNLLAGMGEKWDDAAMKSFTAGGFARLSKKMPHYVVAKGETILQIHAAGPFVLTYVNPKDDPRTKKTP